ncbi:hypothetical protein D3C77_760270 [compost metagenome]
MGSANDQQIVLAGDLQFLFGKACNGNSNAIMVFVYQFNIIGWIATITLVLPCFQCIE